LVVPAHEFRTDSGGILLGGVLNDDGNWADPGDLGDSSAANEGRTGSFIVVLHAY
jgi:hypothetical protein